MAPPSSLSLGEAAVGWLGDKLKICPPLRTGLAVFRRVGPPRPAERTRRLTAVPAPVVRPKIRNAVLAKLVWRLSVVSAVAVACSVFVFCFGRAGRAHLPFVLRTPLPLLLCPVQSPEYRKGRLSHKIPMRLCALRPSEFFLWRNSPRRCASSGPETRKNFSTVPVRTRVPLKGLRP